MKKHINLVAVILFVAGARVDASARSSPATASRTAANAPPLEPADRGRRRGSRSRGAGGFAITGGSLDGNGAPGRRPARSLTVGNGLEPDCTGSLVSPTVFVTAAHCTADLASNRVWVDLRLARTSRARRRLLAGTAYTDPQWGLVKDDSHDLAVVVLDTRGHAASRRSRCRRRRCARRQGRLVADGSRTSATATPTGRSPSTASAARRPRRHERQGHGASSRRDPGGVCFGDSGGPRLLGNVVVAVTSTGNKNCTGQSLSYRLDTPLRPARSSLPFVAAP